MVNWLANERGCERGERGASPSTSIEIQNVPATMDSTRFTNSGLYSLITLLFKIPVSPAAHILFK